MPFTHPNNDYAGGTLVPYCGIGQHHPDSVKSRINVSPESKLGTGDLTLEPGGEVLLSAPSNLGSRATVFLRSSDMAHAVLDVGYNGLPRLSSDSSGVLAFEVNEFDAVTDQSTLGNGRMFLAAGFDGRKVVWPTFTGKRLLPGAGNVYRLGGGDPWPTFGLQGQMLRIRQGVLTGDAALEVGMAGWKGIGRVRLDGPNTFAGPIRVRGGFDLGGLPEMGGTSSLQGLAQTEPGASPFGSPAGAILLHNAALGVRADNPAAQGITKGSLTCSGTCLVDLNGKKGNPAQLALADLRRHDRWGGVLVVAGATGKLQDTERLLVGAWKKDVPLLPPWILCRQGNRLGFASYDAQQGKGVGPVSATRPSLKGTRPADIVVCGATDLAGAKLRVMALQTTGPVTNGAVEIARGGLLLGAEFGASLDFGDTEGVIVGTTGASWLDGKVPGVTGKLSGKKGLTVVSAGLTNPANDFQGPIVVHGWLRAGMDVEENATVRPGTLGNLNNSLLLDGGAVSVLPGGATGNCLAASRTVVLGESGGMFYSAWGAGSPFITIHGKITGPGMLTTPTWAQEGLVIDNPENDYSGGTFVAGTGLLRVTPRPPGQRSGAGPRRRCGPHLTGRRRHLPHGAADRVALRHRAVHVRQARNRLPGRKRLRSARRRKDSHVPHARRRRQRRRVLREDTQRPSGRGG